MSNTRVQPVTQVAIYSTCTCTVHGKCTCKLVCFNSELTLKITCKIKTTS